MKRRMLLWVGLGIALIVSLRMDSSRVEAFDLLGGGTVTSSTTAQPQFSSLGLNAVAPTTAGLVDIVPSDNTNTAHWCINSIQSGFPALGVKTAACPVSVNFASIYSNGTDFIVNGASNGIVHLRLNNTSVLQANATSVAAVGGATLQSTGGAAPTLTAGCNGAGSSVAAGSTNNRGQITTQSSGASTTCTITWSAAGAWNQAPFCVFMGTAGLVPGSCGTATCVFSYTSQASATPINYVCM